jgi:hypothetical protein
MIWISSDREEKFRHIRVAFADRIRHRAVQVRSHAHEIWHVKPRAMTGRVFQNEFQPVIGIFHQGFLPRSLERWSGLFCRRGILVAMVLVAIVHPFNFKKKEEKKRHF